MEFVNIAHPDIEGLGECALSALPIWEGNGWHRVDPVDPEPAQADEPAPTAGPKTSPRRRAASIEE